MADTAQDPSSPSIQEVEVKFAELQRIHAVRSLAVLESLKGYEIPTSKPNAAALAKGMTNSFGEDPNSQLVDRVYEISTGYYARKVKELEGDIAELGHDRNAEMLEVDDKLEESKRKKRQHQHELRKLYSKWNELRSERAWRRSSIQPKICIQFLRCEEESEEGNEAHLDPLKLMLETMERNLTYLEDEPVRDATVPA